MPRHIQFRLANLSMRRERFALHLHAPQLVKAIQRIGSLQSRGLSGEDILNICLNAIHAGSRDPDPAKWLVTEKLLVREIRRTMAAKEKHGGKVGSRRRDQLMLRVYEVRQVNSDREEFSGRTRDVVIGDFELALPGGVVEGARATPLGLAFARLAWRASSLTSTPHAAS